MNTVTPLSSCGSEAVGRKRTYRLVGPDGRVVESAVRGALGGYRPKRLYGRLDCPSALRAIRNGGPYPKHRVFFASEADAIAAGYRPCARCMPAEYAAWKQSQLG